MSYNCYKNYKVHQLKFPLYKQTKMQILSSQPRLSSFVLHNSKVTYSTGVASVASVLVSGDVFPWC